MNGNGTQGRGSLGSIVIMTVILCALVASVIIVAFKLTGGSGDVTTDPSGSTTPPVTTAPPVTTDPSQDFKLESYTASDVHIGPLAIVNSSAVYDFEAQKNSAAKLYDTIPSLNGVIANLGASTAADNDVLLRMTAINALREMMTAFSTDMARNDVIVRTGYRDFEKQQGIYGDGTTAGVSAPGYTEYHTGYAFKLEFFTTAFNTDPADTVKRWAPLTYVAEVNNWFNLHAHEYGFITRYPSGKGDTDFPTGINGIFRYVGIPHATYMFNNGLCFEEYLATVARKSYEDPLEIKISDNEVYHVYFESGEEENNAVHVPTDRPYSVSGNNTNGYIVTVNG